MKKYGEIWKIFLKKMDESELGVEIFELMILKPLTIVILRV
jgi:hypothetical protein